MLSTGYIPSCYQLFCQIFQSRLLKNQSFQQAQAPAYQFQQMPLWYGQSQISVYYALPTLCHSRCWRFCQQLPQIQAHSQQLPLLSHHIYWTSMQQLTNLLALWGCWSSQAPRVSADRLWLLRTPAPRTAAWLFWALLSPSQKTQSLLCLLLDLE